MVHRLVGAQEMKRAFTRRATCLEPLTFFLCDEDHSPSMELLTIKVSNTIIFRLYLDIDFSAPDLEHLSLRQRSGHRSDQIRGGDEHLMVSQGVEQVLLALIVQFR